MKILLKHILKSIGKKPLQPLIIILTLALSMATSVFSFTLADTMKDELSATQAAKYGNAGFQVSVGNTSSSRFLFADDVLDVLGDSAKAVGGYELPLILRGTENTTIAIATEFKSFCDVFKIDFLEYGTVTAGIPIHLPTVLCSAVNSSPATMPLPLSRVKIPRVML